MTRPNRRGFTLVEICVVLGIGVMLLLLGWPRASRLLRQANVRSARSAVIGYYQQARMTALQSGRPTTVWFGSNRMWVTAKPRRNPGSGTYDTLGILYDLNQRYGVTVSASPATVDLNARGLGLTTNNSETLVAIVRSGAQDTVRINQMGRVTK